MFVQRYVTGTGTPALQTLKGGQNADLWGFVATYAEAATYFVKFWWTGNKAIPVIGTTVPDLTVPVSSSSPPFILMRPIIMGGPVYFAVTLNAVGTDDTALGTGGDVISILLE